MVQYRSAGLTCIPLYFGNSCNSIAIISDRPHSNTELSDLGNLGCSHIYCVIRSCDLFDWFTDEQIGFQLDCGHRLKLGKVDHLFNSYSYYLSFFYFQIWFSELTLGSDCDSS